MSIELIISMLLIIPCLALVFYLFGLRSFSKYIALGSGIIELLLGLMLIIRNFNEVFTSSFSLLEISGKSMLSFSLLLDNKALIFTLTLAIISLMVRVYSYFYFKHNDEKERFLSYLSFFTFAMYGIIISGNLLMMFFFWEWVGLASYLMIGFWYKKQEAAQAAKKAFLYNKIGDIAMIMAIALCYFKFGTLEILELNAQGKIAGTLLSIGFLLAASAKSVQLPFSVWLPDAMEGPTPASSILHSATMVAAGVFLLIRVFPIMDAQVLEYLMYAGFITAFWSGLTALTQFDIKQILAYSTISQLSYMMIAIGLGYVEVAFFYMIVHAFIKSPLFLGSGIIINLQSDNLKAEQDPKDIRFMDTLWSQNRLKALLIIIPALALAAIPFSSGFLSKEALISISGDFTPFILALSLITALYSARLIFIPFFHSKNGPTSSKDSGKIEAIMIPVLVLVSFSLFIAFAYNPFNFSKAYLFKDLGSNESSMLLLIISVIISVVGLAIAWFLIRKKGDILGQESSPAVVLRSGVQIDNFSRITINWIMEKGIQLFRGIESFIDSVISFFTYFYVFFAMIMRLSDTYLVDGSVRLMAYGTRRIGNISRGFQRGKLSSYLFWVIAILLIILLVLGIK